MVMRDPRSMLLFFVVLNVSATGLKIHGHGQGRVVGIRSAESKWVSGAISAISLSEESCGSRTGFQEVLGPVVGVVGDFFESRNITVYPWVITMIGAMRWGGMSVRLGEREHIMDHDMDFLVQMPKGSTGEDATNAINGMQATLFHELGVNSTWLNQWFGRDGHLPLFDRVDGKWSNPSGADHMIVIAQHPRFRRLPDRDAGDINDDLGSAAYDYARRVVEATEREAGMPKEHYIISEDHMNRENNKWSPRLKKTGLSHKTALRHLAEFKRDMIAVTAKDPGLRKDGDRFEFDMWVRPGENFDLAYAPSDKKVLFLGHTFPFPRNPNMIAMDLKAVLLERRYEGVDAASYDSMCNLFLPNGTFPEDIAAGAREGLAAIQRARTCSKELDQRGFASFEYCRQSANKL